MQLLRLVVALGAVAALPACNLLALGGEADAPVRNESASSEREERPKAKGEERTSRRDDESDRDEPRRETASSGRDWIVGRWGDAECQTIVEFHGDGTFAINGAEGQWSLDGDALTMSGGGGQQVYTVDRSGGSGFSLADMEGNVEQLGRC